MISPRQPSLYQINTRVWLTELSRGRGRAAPRRRLLRKCWESDDDSFTNIMNLCADSSAHR